MLGLNSTNRAGPYLQNKEPLIQDIRTSSDTKEQYNKDKANAQSSKTTVTKIDCPEQHNAYINNSLH